MLDPEDMAGFDYQLTPKGRAIAKKALRRQWRGQPDQEIADDLTDGKLEVLELLLFQYARARLEAS